MNCQKATLLFSAHLDGELSGKAESFLENHLRECKSCAALLVETKESDSLLSQALQSLPHPPPDFSRTVMRRIRSAAPRAAEGTEGRRPRLAWLPKPALAVAAGLFILTVVFFCFYEKIFYPLPSSKDASSASGPQSLPASAEEVRLAKILTGIRRRIDDLEKTLARLNEKSETETEPGRTSEGTKEGGKKAFEKSMLLLRELEEAALLSEEFTSRELRDRFLRFLGSSLDELKDKIPPELIRSRLGLNNYSPIDLALAKLLSQISDPGSADFFLQGLFDRNVPLDFRKAYAEGLLALSDPTLIPTLELFVKSVDEDEEIRITLMKSIYEASPEEALDLLTSIAQFDANPRIRGEALDLLTRYEDQEYLVNVLGDCMKNDLSPDNSLKCLYALAEIGTNRALEILSDFINSFPANGDPVLLDKAKSLYNKSSGTETYTLDGGKSGGEKKKDTEEGKGK